MFYVASVAVLGGARGGPGGANLITTHPTPTPPRTLQSHRTPPPPCRTSPQPQTQLCSYYSSLCLHAEYFDELILTQELQMSCLHESAPLHAQPPARESEYSYFDMHKLIHAQAKNVHIYYSKIAVG